MNLVAFALRRPITVFVLVLALPAKAAQPQTSPSQKDNLTQESAQTLATLFSITIRDIFIPSRWGAPETANILELRPTIPFKLWDQINLMRVTIPYRTQSNRGSGLNDVRVFDLLGFKENWGLWGVGPVVNFGVSGVPVPDTFQAGPAAGFVFMTPKWSIGLLNQNLFSGQIAASTLQPILSYQINETWTISLGDLPFVYDFKRDSFIFAPVGFQLGAVAKIWEQPIRFFLNPQFNTRNFNGSAQWTMTSGISFLIPPDSR